MSTVKLCVAAGLALILAACATTPGTQEPMQTEPQTERAAESTPMPPKARVVAKELETHGHKRTDQYYWLKERENPEVIAYLEAENQYTDAVLAHTEELQTRLYDEIVARIPQSDESVPFFLDGYWYIRRFEPGKEYPIYTRRKGSLEAPEEVMLDVNELARGHEYFAAAGLKVSDNNEILAYATDDVGRRIYTLRFKNLRTGETLADAIPAVTPNSAWAADNKTIFYTKQHPETLRWYQIWRHELGTDPSKDVLVYEEPDDTFSSFIFRSKSKGYLILGSSQTLADEYRVLRADDPRGEFRVVEPRQRGREYYVDHFGEHFYIRTNDGAKNFRLMKTPVDKPGRANWTEVVPGREEVFLDSFEIFRNFLVLTERQDGLERIRVMPWSGSGEHYIAFNDPAYTVYPKDNPEIDTDVLRYDYASLTTPTTTYDYNMKTHERKLMKQEKVGGGFETGNYRAERIYAPARDGARVPISLVYRKGFERNGEHPVLLYGYGSYGSSADPGFNSSVISLVDRGFVYAIAHIRGGQEYGRDWYEKGKLFHKKNTFTDFIDAAEHLVKQKYADPDEVFAYGGSAGGLLMGAVANMRPDLFKGIVSRVPFVDVITTMLDPDIPLTTSEYDEWGDPNDKAYYDYILSYSPYDNIERKNYPHMLVTTGLHDSQVQYWEPAKYVAKLRSMKTDDNLVLLETNMDAGHGGASGRFRRHKETALIYAFLLSLTEEAR